MDFARLLRFPLMAEINCSYQKGALAFRGHLKRQLSLKKGDVVAVAITLYLLGGSATFAGRLARLWLGRPAGRTAGGLGHWLPWRSEITVQPASDRVLQNSAH